MRKKEIARDLLINYLTENSIEFAKSRVGINFQVDTWKFLLWHDANDPLFFRLALPGLLDVTDENYAAALMACNMVNWNYKVAKASLYEYEERGRRHASVWICFEQILETTTLDFSLPATAIQTLLGAAEYFQTIINE